MRSYGGFLFVIDEAARASLFQDETRVDASFSDTLSAPDWHPKDTEIFLVSLRGQDIHYASLVSRGRRVATHKYQIRFSHLYTFEPPVPLHQVTGLIRSNFRRYFIRSSSGMGQRVPPATWQAIVRALKQLRPESADALDELERLCRPTVETSSRPGAEMLSLERDAVNVAVRMADFDERVITHHHAVDEAELAPFLVGLDSAVRGEDPIIEQDSRVFGAWTLLASHRIGTSVFEKGRERLTLFNVNRQPLERTLGVDLIYYNHRYRSYVMVQYKRMLEEGGEPCYRPTDSSYSAELERMRRFRGLLPASEDQAALSLDEYRLYCGLFYFKLCEAEIFQPTSTEMISGMYIPLDYWELLIGKAIGPRGGERITRENVGRYLNNSLFIQLVQSGWVGSRVCHETLISGIIRESLTNNRSVILAAKQRVGTKPEMAC